MLKLVKNVLNYYGIDLVRFKGRQKKFSMLHQKYQNFTMIPLEAFVINLEIIEEFKNVEGDFVECGVWKGGMSAAASTLLGSDKKIHLFDSFEGLPPAKEIDGEAALEYQVDTQSDRYLDNCAIDESFAVAAMKLSGTTKYKIYKGWFENTLIAIETKKIAILRIDGDWYDSVMECLEKLYPLVVDGGVIIIDDYYTWDGCSKAIHDFLSRHKFADRVFQKNNIVAYIKKIRS